MVRNSIVHNELWSLSTLYPLLPSNLHLYLVQCFNVKCSWSHIQIMIPTLFYPTHTFILFSTSMRMNPHYDTHTFLFNSHIFYIVQYLNVNTGWVHNQLWNPHFSIQLTPLFCVTILTWMQPSSQPIHPTLSCKLHKQAMQLSLVVSDGMFVKDLWMLTIWPQPIKPAPTNYNLKHKKL